MTNIKPNTDLFANHHGWTDVHPFEIVRIVSEKCIEVRSVTTGDNKTKMDFHVGGFSAHCSNQHAQDYDYTTNPEAEVFKLRKRKDGNWYGGWMGGYYAIAEKPCRFYDYNF